jgi:hypothetical protein
VLEAGDSIAIETSAVDLNVVLRIFELEATGPLKCARITSWAAGDNDLIVCPEGRIYLVASLTTESITSRAFLVLSNESGGAVTMVAHKTTVGGATSNATRLTADLTVNDNAISSVACQTALEEDERIVVNSSADTAGLFAICAYFDLEA